MLTHTYLLILVLTLESTTNVVNDYDRITVFILYIDFSISQLT